MTNQRTNQRASTPASADGPQPKSRGKTKGGRIRSSLPKKSSLPLPTSKLPPGSNTIPNITPTTSTQIHPNKPPPHTQQRTNLSAGVTQTHKRGRAPSLSREPDAKRQKATNDFNSTLNSRHIGKPASPTTSSRSRKGRNRRWDGEASSNTNTTGTSNPSARMRASKNRAQNRSNAIASSSLVFLADVNSHLVGPRPTILARRFFGHEIQSIMHAFGEIRHCARPVLELVEDATRDVVNRALKQAVELANGNQITIDHIIYSVRNNSAAKWRLQNTLKIYFHEKGEKYKPQTAPVFPIKSHDWIDQLSYLTDDVSSLEREVTIWPIEIECCAHAKQSFRFLMERKDYEDLKLCRDVSLIRGKSTSPALKSGGMNRLDLFKEWLGINQKPHLELSTDVIVALAHLAWEAIGCITQTALVVRHFNDTTDGIINPISINWTQPRHLITAVGHGIMAGVMVPISEYHMKRMIQEVERLFCLQRNCGNIKLREVGNMTSHCLRPAHIREALRLLNPPSDQVLAPSMNGLCAQGLFKT